MTAVSSGAGGWARRSGRRRADRGRRRPHADGMAVSAVLRVTEVTVAPGGVGRCHVLVRNRSVVVDQFEFTVRGEVSDWTQVRPARVNLMPEQEVSIELTFSPPRSSEVLAGT